MYNVAVRLTAFIVWSMTLLVAARAAADAARLPRPDVTPAERNTIERLLELLQREAHAIQHEKKLTISEPDIASRFDEQVDPETLGIVLLHRTHREPFLDAYTRWQLLSFEPVFPELSPQQFFTFITEAPPMMENPWARAETVELFTRAENAGPLDKATRRRLRELEVELTQFADIAGHLNHPAEQFRKWVAEQIGETGPLPRLWLLEQCSATIDAGWSTRSIKTRISNDFSNSVADGTFTERDRHIVALAAEQLAGHRRQFVSQFAFKADGTIDVRFSTAQVTAADVQKWRDRLFDRVIE